MLSISLLYLLLSVIPILADSTSNNMTQDKNIIRDSFNLDYTVSVPRNDLDLKVRTFLSNNTLRFGINPDNLLLFSSYTTQKPGSLSVLKYEQTYKGLPVYSSNVIVALRDGKVVTIKSNYDHKTDLNTKPTLNETRALEAIEKDLGIAINRATLKLHGTFRLEDFKRQNFKLQKSLSPDRKIRAERISAVIYPLGKGAGTVTEYRLAYKVELGLIKSPPARWVYIVDANSGEILNKYNTVVFNTLSGKVTGQPYPEHPNQMRVVKGLWNETLYSSPIIYSSNVFWSGSGDNFNNYIITSSPINLTGASSAVLEFKTRYSTENGYDFGLVGISTDGLNFTVIREYTGNLNSWINQSIDISSYSGQKIWIGFFYQTDSSIAYDGWYIDNTTVRTNSGIVFNDNSNNFNNWNNSGFSVKQENIVIYPILGNTGVNGNYNISGLPASVTLYSELKGQFVDVSNYTGTHTNHSATITTPSTHSWDWKDNDTSYKQEETNIFYHVNKIHDFFTNISPFDIYTMNYQTIANFEYPGTCNAFSDGIDIYLYGAGGGCEATSLFSDIIYHEYTHNVVNHVYSVPLPYSGESGALNEGWADYFASTVNNNSCMAEGFAGLSCGRYLNNTYRYPYDIVGEVHDDSRIVSGAAWDLRQSLGASISDRLIINAMKLEPFNFTEYLEDIIVADDNNSNLKDGTPHLLQICTVFYNNHGIYSSYCSRFYPVTQVKNILLNPMFENGNINWREYSSGGYKIITNNPTAAHSGIWFAYMGDYDNARDYIYQNVTIPSNATQAYIQFWYWILTDEITANASDRMNVEIRRPSDNTLLKSLVSLSNLNMTYGYRISNQYNVSQFKGQTIQLRFNTTTDSSRSTLFIVDDTALMISDTTSPASITNLRNMSYATNYINWTWIDPKDVDFYRVMVYLDGKFRANISKGVQYYNATGLLPYTVHTISTRTVDTSGNINRTWINHTAGTKPDSTPPRSITNLVNRSYTPTYINWIWIDPSDYDFSKVMIYINGIFKTNVTKGIRYYNATGLIPNTSYWISTHTIDTSGNINKTWVNHTARTARDYTLPASITNLRNISYAPNYINWTWIDPKDADYTKVIIYIDNSFKTNASRGKQFYNATGLTQNTTYKISTRTVDTSGNINKTWVNNSAMTRA